MSKILPSSLNWRKTGITKVYLATRGWIDLDTFDEYVPAKLFVQPFMDFDSELKQQVTSFKAYYIVNGSSILELGWGKGTTAELALSDLCLKLGYDTWDYGKSND